MDVPQVVVDTKSTQDSSLCFIASEHESLLKISVPSCLNMAEVFVVKMDSLIAWLSELNVVLRWTARKVLLLIQKPVNWLFPISVIWEIE